MPNLEPVTVKVAWEGQALGKMTFETPRKFVETWTSTLKNLPIPFFRPEKSILTEPEKKLL